MTVSSFSAPSLAWNSFQLRTEFRYINKRNCCFVVSYTYTAVIFNSIHHNSEKNKQSEHLNVLAWVYKCNVHAVVTIYLSTDTVSLLRTINIHINQSMLRKPHALQIETARGALRWDCLSLKHKCTVLVYTILVRHKKDWKMYVKWIRIVGALVNIINVWVFYFQRNLKQLHSFFKLVWCIKQNVDKRLPFNFFASVS